MDWHQIEPAWARLHTDWFFSIDRASVSGPALAFGAWWLAIANAWGRRSDGSAVICDQAGLPLDHKRLGRLCRITARLAKRYLEELEAVGALLQEAPGVWIFPDMQATQEGPDAARARRKRATRDVDKVRTCPDQTEPVSPDMSDGDGDLPPQTPPSASLLFNSQKTRKEKNDSSLESEAWHPPTFSSPSSRTFVPSKRDLKMWQKKWPHLDLELELESAWHSQERRLAGEGETPPWRYPRVGIEKWLARAEEERKHNLKIAACAQAVQGRAQGRHLRVAYSGRPQERAATSGAHRPFEEKSPEMLKRLAEASERAERAAKDKEAETLARRDEANTTAKRFLTPEFKASLGIKE